MAARNNPVLQRAFGDSLQENTKGYRAPDEDILNQIRAYFDGYKNVQFMSPEEQMVGQNSLGSNQFTDENGWLYSPQAYNHGLGGRNVFHVSSPEEQAKFAANPNYRPKGAVYDADTGEYLWEQEFTSKADGNRGLKIGLGAVGGMFGASQLGLLGPGAANASGAGAGIGSNVAGHGAFVGEGALSGIPAWDAAMASALPAGASAAGSAASNLMDSGVPPNPYDPSGVPPNPFVEGAKAAAPGLLDSATDIAKIAAPVLGAVAGAQGQENKETTQQKMDPRLDPYVFGANGQPGLLGHAQNLMNQQMAPGYMAGADQMRSVGLGLLNTPVRGNGFDLFTRGRY